MVVAVVAAVVVVAVASRVHVGTGELVLRIRNNNSRVEPRKGSHDNDMVN